MEPEKRKSHREQAEELFAQVDPASTDGLYKSAVGHALLAIHEEIRAIRLKYDPPAKEPGKWGRANVSY